MSQVTPRQKQYKILLVGDSCSDIYVFGNCDRLSPEAPVPVFRESSRKVIPGMTINVAESLTNLGSKVSVITNKRKIKKTRFVDRLSSQHILRVDDEEAVEEITNIKIDQIDPEAYDALVLSDYDKGFLPFKSAQKLCDKFVEKSVPVFVDSKKVNLSCYEGAIIKINKHEKMQVKKMPDSSSLITTLGSQGADYENEHFPPYQTKVSDKHGHRDVCGAGDAFLAALVHRFLRNGKDLKEAISFSNKCAAIVVGYFGTRPVTKKDLEEEGIS